MPPEFDRLRQKIAKSLKGKKNPRTKKPYTDSEIYAIAVAAWKKTHGGKAPGRESLKDVVLNYSVPIIAEGIANLRRKDFVIRGTAINETITRNNIKYIGEELEKAAPSLVGKPILKDHKHEVDSIIGRVSESIYQNKGIQFGGIIKDSKSKEMIQDGRITNVSVGAKVKDLIKVEGEGEAETHFIAKGMEFLELSLVAVPGDPNATIMQAITEAFDGGGKENNIIVEKIMEDIRMEEKMKKLEEKMEKVKEELKAKDEALKKAQESLNKIEEEKRQKLISEIKELDKEAKVGELSEEALIAIKESLTRVKEEDEDGDDADEDGEEGEPEKDKEDGEEAPEKKSEAPQEKISTGKKDEYVLEKSRYGANLWKK